MMDIKIFVEGKHDREFLEQYLEFLQYPQIEIIPCNGNNIKYKTNNKLLYEDTISKMNEFSDNNNKILLIFDADYDFNTTLDRLRKESANLLNNENIFLFPDNSKSGELETLLFDIATEKQICECFLKYKNCIEQYKKEYIKNIHKKSLRYAYFEALGLSLSDNSKEKEQREKAYKIIFDLNSKHLEPLKNFLQYHLG